jgi:hypothetical protein
VQTYRSDQYDSLVAILLPEFRQCDRYADRLRLWEQHRMTDLFYSVAQNRETVFQFTTWEEVKQLPVMTLHPFTEQEAQQFTTWALQIRPGLKRPAASRTFIEERLVSIPSHSERTRFLTNYSLIINALKESQWAKAGLSPDLMESALGIDQQHYYEMIQLLRVGHPVPLAHWIWQYENLNGPRRMDWRLVDTYLLADGVVKASAYLEELTVEQQSVQVVQTIPEQNIQPPPANQPKNSRINNGRTQAIARRAVTFFEKLVEDEAAKERGKRNPKAKKQIVADAISRYREQAPKLKYGASVKTLRRYLEDIGKPQAVKEYAGQLVGQILSGK